MPQVHKWFTKRTKHRRSPKNRRSVWLTIDELETRDVPSAVTANNLRSTPLEASANPASIGPVGHTPDQIRHAYGFDQIRFSNGAIPGDGSGQTIAIVDAYDDPNIANDLHAFDQDFGLADPEFTKVAQDGSTNYPGTDTTGGWESEVALDVEWAHAIAPGAKILLVEANDSSDQNLFTAINFAARQPGVVTVSMSIQGNESSADLNFDSSFLTPSGHGGVTFVAASGDNGVVSFLSSSPNVLGVGGTSLTLDANGNYQGETAWNNSTGSSGGGISQFEPVPNYQKPFLSQGVTGRASPDVAYDGDPNTGFAIYNSFNNGQSPWEEYGGTSAGAPQWAALIAIADQGRSVNGLGSLDGATQTLPMIYSLPASDFHDITSGSNKGFSAGPGYDMVTGRGSPLANQVVIALAGQPVQRSVPTLISPNRTALTATPTFSWNGVSSATHYEIYVLNLVTGQVIDTRVTGTTWTASSLIHGDSYRWWVRALDGGAGTAAWSGSLDFAVGILATPTLLGPSGTFTTGTPTFTWNAVNGADHYEIYVLNLATGQVVDTRASANSWTPSSPLAHGDSYRWWARALDNSGDTSAWSNAMNFGEAPLATPTLLGPTGSLTTGTPTFTWNPVAGADHYEIYVWNVGTGQVIDTYVTNATWAPLSSLARGDSYRWWVRALDNGGGGGAWSSGLNFAEASLGTPTLLGPSGSTTGTPTFSWNPVAGADHYEIYVWNVGTSQVIDTTAPTNSRMSPSALVSGDNYRWWVRALSSDGSASLWSNSLDFTLTRNQQQGRLTYHNGPLLMNVGIETVYYGQAWTNDQSLQQQALNLDGYLGFLTNSSYMDLLTQYGVGHGRFLDHDFNANDPPQAGTVQDSQIQQMLVGEIQQGSLQAPDANRLYVVFAPPGYTVTAGTEDSVNNFLGYHSTFQDANLGTIYYVVIPYASAPNATIQGMTGFQQDTVVLSHEVAESATDADCRTGWFDDALGVTGEIGDLAVNHFGVLNGYVVQAEWSNQDGGPALPNGAQQFGGAAARSASNAASGLLIVDGLSAQAAAAQQDDILSCQGGKKDALAHRDLYFASLATTDAMETGIPFDPFAGATGGLSNNRGR